MELKKTGEGLNRSFNELGEAIESVNMIQFNVVEDDQTVGNVTLYADQAVINLTISGFNGMESGEAKVKELLAMIGEKF